MVFKNHNKYPPRVKSGVGIIILKNETLIKNNNIMKKKEKYLVSIKPALEGVFHVATSITTNIYKAQGVSGRNVISQRLRKY